MHSRRNFSNTSAPFRCEWRPSRWLTCALVLLGMLGALSLLTCELKTTAAWPLALAVLCTSLWLARREAARPVRHLLLSPALANIDAMAVETPELLEYGPLAILRWRVGKHRGQLAFWPDTLPRAQRRELRLAVRAHAVSR
ncbi:MAG: hypothetical protein WA956_13480 [Stenotrophomonas sp.]